MKKSYIRTLAAVFGELLLAAAFLNPTAACLNSETRSAQVERDTSRSVPGEWQGTLEAGAAKLRLLLKLSRTSEGKLSGTLDSIDQGANDIPITTFTYSADEITLELKSIGASYKGKLSADGNEIIGQWKQGAATLPLSFKRSLQSGAAAIETPKGLPAPLSGFQDQATFLLFLNEERVGTTQSNWKSDGSFENQATLSVAGQNAKTSLKITPDSEGRWKDIVIESALGVMTLTRDGSSVRRTFRDKTTTFETRAGVLLFDNYSPALVSQAVRRYDRSQGGQQKFPVLILSAIGVNATLEAKEKIQRTVGGRDLMLTKFIYGLPGVDVQIWVDETGKLYLADVPAQNAAFVREGYEELRKPPEPDALISTAKYEVGVQSNIGVPMRDGIKLATDFRRSTVQNYGQKVPDNLAFASCGRPGQSCPWQGKSILAQMDRTSQQ